MDKTLTTNGSFVFLRMWTLTNVPTKYVYTFDMYCGRVKPHTHLEFHIRVVKALIEGCYSMFYSKTSIHLKG